MFQEKERQLLEKGGKLRLVKDGRKTVLKLIKRFLKLFTLCTEIDL